jgi:polar amino acid transport system substrate-binding protein
MKRKLRQVVMVGMMTVVAVVGMTSITLAADTSWEAIQAKKQLVVGFCAQYPPFEFKNDKGQFEGFDVDLGNAIGQKLGVDILFKDGEWQGLIAGMKKGDYDMLITCMGETTARKENVNFSDVYIDLTEVLVVRKEESKIASVADLADKTVGAQFATSSERVVDGLADQVGDIKKYNYTTEAFLDLKFKRIDALVCGMAYAIVQIKKDPSFKIVGEPLNATPIVMALPKGADALTAKINDALTRVRADGAYDKIYDTWIRLN